MKILIVYASKYGCTKDCVLYLKNALHGDVMVCSVQEKISNLEQFDTVLIGSSIYMNAIQKGIKEFCNKNLKILMNKRIGLFIGCYTPADTKDYINTFFPEELLSHAACKSIFGGEMRYDTMNVLYRKLFQWLQKLEGFQKGFKEPYIDYAEIQRFARVMEKI